MTLEGFYELMAETARARRELVAQRADADIARVLRNTRDGLRRLSGAPESAILKLGEGEIAVNLEYEITELEKDLVFLEGGRSALKEWLAKRHEGFAEKVRDCVAYLRDADPDLFVTDRDGTINNYCARYRSSIQSAYNARYVSRFAAKKGRRNIILTSAPLHGGGLLDVNCLPENQFVLAGSMGREYRDENGRDDRLALTHEQTRLMTDLNEALESLTSRPEYREFTLIGSGLQYKFGQTTIARQDQHGSIPRARSEEFLEAVRALVGRVDPEGRGLRAEDTGFDVEIMLTSPEGGDAPSRGFNKGDGLLFLDRRLGLKAADGCVLVCGDTIADVPMLDAARELRPRLKAIFVGVGKKFRRFARITSADTLFVDSPDILVTALDQAASES